MNSSPAGRQRFLKLALLALLCALPFLAVLVYLERQVERIDTLPVDEYKSLVWAPDGSTLLFLHRPLIEGAETELYSRDSSGAFSQLGKLSGDQDWRLTGQSVDDAVVLAASSGGVEKLATFESGAAKPIELPSEWTLLPSEGSGLFYSKVVNDVPFDQMVDVEDAPEVESPEPASEAASTAQSSASPGAPTRSGLQIARYNRQTGAADVVLTIPFSNPTERPSVSLVRESPDKRFLALVTEFGEAGTAGLWVYDSEASRLLWTRVITDGEVHGMDWSPSSVALAVCDSQGIVVLDNVLSIESTRYEAQGLGTIRPLFAEESTLYLVGVSSLHKLDRQAGQAQMVFDSHSKGFDVLNFVVNPTAGRAAFFSSPKGHLQLMVYDLDSPEALPTVSELPGSLRHLAQGTMSYQIGDALRTAWRFWKG
jgi:hypothetical protein